MKGPPADADPVERLAYIDDGEVRVAAAWLPEAQAEDCCPRSAGRS